VLSSSVTTAAARARVVHNQVDGPRAHEVPPRFRAWWAKPAGELVACHCSLAPNSASTDGPACSSGARRGMELGPRTNLTHTRHRENSGVTQSGQNRPPTVQKNSKTSTSSIQELSSTIGRNIPIEYRFGAGGPDPLPMSSSNGARLGTLAS
jgi:hypothetical protein